MGKPPEIIQATINKDGTEMAKMFDRVHYRIKEIKDYYATFITLLAQELQRTW